MLLEGHYEQLLKFVYQQSRDLEVPDDEYAATLRALQVARFYLEYFEALEKRQITQAQFSLYKERHQNKRNEILSKGFVETARQEYMKYRAMQGYIPGNDNHALH